MNRPEPTTVLFAKRSVMSSVQVRKAVLLGKHRTTTGSENFSEKIKVISNEYPFYTKMFIHVVHHISTIDTNKFCYHLGDLRDLKLM